jgi:hypothetical protein
MRFPCGRAGGFSFGAARSGLPVSLQLGCPPPLRNDSTFSDAQHSVLHNCTTIWCVRFQAIHRCDSPWCASARHSSPVDGPSTPGDVKLLLPPRKAGGTPILVYSILYDRSEHYNRINFLCCPWLKDSVDSFCIPSSSSGRTGKFRQGRLNAASDDVRDSEPGAQHGRLRYTDWPGRAR